MKKLFYLIPVLLIIDQATKLLSINQNLTLIPNILLVKYSVNPGIVFGIFSNNLIATVIFPFIFTILFLYLYFKERNKPRLFSLGVVFAISGLLGNLIDRFAYGHVIDFILIPIKPERNVSLFNFADVFLIAGIILLIVYYYKKD